MIGKKLGREVALKILSPEIAGDPQRVARFRREALAVAALKHPDVVTLYAAEEAGGQPFLAVELVEGQTLRSEVRAGGIPLGRFFDLAIPLAQAISSAHDKGTAPSRATPAPRCSPPCCATNLCPCSSSGQTSPTTSARSSADASPRIPPSATRPRATPTTSSGICARRSRWRASPARVRPRRPGRRARASWSLRPWSSSCAALR